MNVGVAGEYDQVRGHSQVQVQSFDGRTHKLYYSWLWMVTAKGFRLQSGIGSDVYKSAGEARWEWGVAALAVLFQESCEQCPLLTTTCGNVQEAILTASPTMAQMLALVTSICLQPLNQMTPCDPRLPKLVSWVAG